MRIEWGEAIRYHRWDALEWLAKKDPSQDLCDTVFELAAGIDSKAEQRSLKKVLFLLRQRGFRPSVIVQAIEEESNKPKLPRGCRAYMAAPYGGNFTGFWVNNPGVKEDCQVYWWVNEFLGEMQTKERKIVKKLSNWYMMSRAPLLDEEDHWLVPVDAGYALYRIARVYSKREPDYCTFEHSIKSFNRLLALAIPMEHPGVGLPVAKVSSAQLRQACSDVPSLRNWKISFPEDHHVRDAAFRAAWDPILSDEERKALIRNELEKWLHATFSDEGVRIYAEGCLDLAYCLDGREEYRHMAPIVMAIRQDYQRLGPKAALCDHVLDLSASALLKEIMAEESESMAVA